MEMLQGVWKQHLRPRAVVGYGVKIFLPSPPNYVTRSPGYDLDCKNTELTEWIMLKRTRFSQMLKQASCFLSMSFNLTPVMKIKQLKC